MDFKDYAENPSKYTRFSTARLIGGLFTHNGENDLPADTIVGLEWLEHRINPIGNRMEPLYRVSKGGRSATVHGSALYDFVL